MEKIENKFIRYVKIDTESSESSSTYPSTSKQLILANLLKDELNNLGLEAEVDEFGLVYCKIEGDNSKKKIGLIAHMDTAPTLPGGNFEPRFIYNYDGNDIKLNEKYTLSPKQFPTLKNEIRKNPELFGLLPKEEYPVIIAFDACKESVSFQIHPTDAYARNKLNL